MPGIQTLASIVRIDPNNLTAEGINDYIKKLFAKTNAKTAKQKDAEFFKKFNPFFNEIKRNPGKKGCQTVEWEEIKKKSGDSAYYGAVTSPFSYYVADQLNKKPLLKMNL